MLFVSVHCQDEIDRERLIPLHLVTRVEINADGSDYIYVEDGYYIPRIQDSFYMSIKDVKGIRLEDVYAFANTGE